MRLLLRFPFLVLQIVAGLLTAYGTFAMISTAGLQPLNPVMLLGLIAVAVSGRSAVSGPSAIGRSTGAHTGTSGWTRVRFGCVRRARSSRSS